MNKADRQKNEAQCGNWERESIYKVWRSDGDRDLESTHCLPVLAHLSSLFVSESFIDQNGRIQRKVEAAGRQERRGVLQRHQ
jgi:hypothetical protein